MQMELEGMRAASPRARSMPKAIYGAAALARIDLIRAHTISPHRRKPAYEVGCQPSLYSLRNSNVRPCASVPAESCR